MAAILDFKLAEFGPDLACVTNFLKCPYYPLTISEVKMKVHFSAHGS